MLRIAVPISLVIAFITTLLFANVSLAAPGINKTINFQGRLLNAAGATVPDGYYNIQFKIYQDGTGTVAGNPSGTLKWTESYVNNGGTSGVMVKNGFLSVNLGSQTAFGSSIDWDQDTLWLSMNIAGSAAGCTTFGNSPCTADGEMLPMKRMTASPYALNSGLLAGKSADNFVQLAQGLQTDASTSSSIFINKTNTGNLLQLQNTATDVFTVGNAGDLSLGNNANKTLSIATSAASTIGRTLTVSAGAGGSGSGSEGGELVLTGGAAGGTNANGGSVTINGGVKTGSGVAGSINIGIANAANTIQIGSTTLSGGTQSINIGTNNTAGGTTNVTIGAGSNATAGTTSLRSRDNLTITTNNTTRATFSTTGALILGDGLTSSSTGTFVLQGSTGAASNAGYGIAIQGGTGGSGAGSAGGNLTLYGGTGGGTNGAAGHLVLDSGTPTGSGAKGIISIGAVNTGTISIGNNIASTGVAIQGGTGTVGLQTTATGTINIGTNNAANTIQLGSASLSSGTQSITIGGANTAGGTQNITIGSSSGAAGGTTTIQSKGETTIATNGTNRATFSSSGNTLYLGNANGSGVHASPNAFLVQGTSNSGTGAGGALTLQAGNSGTAANGANLTLSGGTSANGVNGLVVLTTPTFQTYNTGAAYSCGAGPCNIPQSSVDNNAVVVVSATAQNLTLNLPNPTISGSSAYGRIIYVTGDYGSQNFTLAINGGGSVSNLISMRSNASATLIWGPGNAGAGAWTAAGASSSTTLQAAYDNTIQSSGGAELIVGKTSNTNGLTIRDSSVNPVNGALMSVQSSSAANLFSVNSNVTDYASNPGAETPGASSSTFPSNTWTAQGTGATVSRNTVTNNSTIATGQASVGVTTTGSVNSGVKNQIIDPSISTPTPIALTAKNHYNISFSARLPAGASIFNTLDVHYSPDGTTGSLVSCAVNKVVNINTWSKINCSFAAPTSGITTSNAIFIRQSDGASRTFYIDNISVTIAADYSIASDGGVDDSVNFSTNYLTTGTGATTPTRVTADGNTASSSAETTVSATGSYRGIKNKLAIDPLKSARYRISVYVRQTSGTAINDFAIRYTYDGGTNNTACEDYTTRTLTSSWAKISCYMNIPSNTITNAQVAFTEENVTSTSTFRIDDFSMTLATPTTPNLQVGSGANGGPTTLFTLDRGASAPIAGDNEELLGSMYYDTTLGKLQCYEADGWGACGSSPDNIVTISPEYTNAVMHGTGVGTMTSDFCADNILEINNGDYGQPTICGTNETRNFYQWTSPQFTAQEYSVYVTYQLPSTFKQFLSGSMSLQAKIDSTANANVSMQIFKSASGGMVSCGNEVQITTSANSWLSPTATGQQDPSTCGFSAGNRIVFKINMEAKQNANAYISDISFAYSNF